MDRETDGFEFSRRTVLKSGAGIALATGTAGCNGLVPSEVRSYEFAASPVGLQETPDRLEYHQTANPEQTVERERSVLGTEVTVTLSNYGSVYRGGRDTLGLLASPLATVPGAGPQNPLADASLREVLTGPLGDRLLGAADVVDRQGLTWSRGPTEVATREAELLGQTTTIRSFAGVLDGRDFVLLTVARARDAGDAVFAMTALKREAGDGQTLVGGDGVVSRATVTGAVDRLETLLGFVTRTGVGIHILASSHAVPEGTSENYVRAVIKNEHDEKTLHSVGLMMQVFDEKGEFLDMQVAGIDRLGPDETFEGHIPYVGFGKEAAAYAIESHYTTRDVASETADDIEVTDRTLEAGAVTGTVHNTGTEAAEGFTLRVTFYGEDGVVVGTASRQFGGLPEGGSEAFEADVAETGAMPETTATDYDVETVRYNRQPLYVR